LIDAAKQKGVTMKKSILAAGAAFVLFLLVAGCTMVEIQHPLSAQPEPVDKDKFEGTWLLENSAIEIRFACNGVAKLAMVGWEDDQFRLVHGEMIVTEGKHDNFISFRGEEAGEWMTNYILLKYKFTEDGYLLLWWSSQEAFAAAIENNLLSGVVKRSLFLGRETIDSVTLASPPDELLKFIDDPERRDLFDYRDPDILRKIASPQKDEQNPCRDFMDQKSGSDSDADPDNANPSEARSEGDL
jgi:hypothetical protein